MSGEPCGGELLSCGARIRKHSTKEKTARPKRIVQRCGKLGSRSRCWVLSIKNLQLTNALGALCQSGGPRPWRGGGESGHYLPQTQRAERQFHLS